MKISLLKAFIEVIEKYYEYTIRYYDLNKNVNEDVDNIKYILHLLGYKICDIDFIKTSDSFNTLVKEEYYSEINNKYFTLEMII